jgi:integrase
MKAPNGYGSVVYLGKNRRKPYAVRITVSRELITDENGKVKSKQKYAYLSYHEKAKDAHIALATYNANKVDGAELAEVKKLIPTKVPTFEELFEEWYERKENSNKKLSTSTMKVYRSNFNLLKDYHKKPITFFDSNNLQAIFDSYAYLSKAHVTQIHTILNNVLQLARKKKIIKENELNMCELTYKENKEKIHNAFSTSEILALWENSNDEIVKMILITIYSGLRPQELLSLKQENIYLEESYMIGGMKTVAGTNRTIPIHQKIKPLIRYFEEKNSNSVFLFPAIRGKGPYNYNTFLKNYDNIIKRLEISKHLPHDGRHTCSTLMAEQGIPLMYRQKILGHSSGNITDDVYVHLDRKILIEEINKIDV